MKQTAGTAVFHLMEAFQLLTAYIVDNATTLLMDVFCFIPSEEQVEMEL